jgi:chemotaxis response regulator CheB
MAIHSGNADFASEGHHLVVKEGNLCMGSGLSLIRAKPSIDYLFTSSAYFFQEKLIGIFLTGYLRDESN